ncbi:MAG TPA: ABC transporter permease [Anaerolineales bacterium]|nr:ABC transporter permease [Anaerolineales bacterium]
MSLIQNLIRRLLLIIPMAIGITLLLFVVTHIVPVNPLAVILTERSMDDPEAVAAATQKWGLDKPLPLQYVIYLKNLLQGDLGTSFKTKNPVASDLKTFLPATIELSICSFLFAILFGLPLGIIAAYKADSFADQVTRIISLLGASMPPFWSGLLILFLFYYKLGWAPGPGRINSRIGAPESVTGLFVFDSLLKGNMPAFWSSLSHLVLPSIILGWFTLALISRITRSSMLEVLSQDYIRTARAKGVSEKWVILKHALRNALIPLVTLVGLAFAGLMSGAIMTETIFSWPGIGRYAVESAANLDYPAITGTTLLIAIIYMLVNIFVDMLYTIIDPRIREG